MSWIVGQKGVKYGLEVRAPPGSKPPAQAAKRRSVFGEDDDDDDAVDNVEQQITRQAARKQSDQKVGLHSSDCGWLGDRIRRSFAAQFHAHRHLPKSTAAAAAATASQLRLGR